MLQKQSLNINFAQGLDTKTDPKQVTVGKFLTLTNSVFDLNGALSKRSGYPIITTLPNTVQTTLTAYNDNLIATGSSLYAFNAASNQWINHGLIQPIQLDTLPLVRVSTSQSAPDTATCSLGLTCVTYTDNSAAYYHILDSATGQQVISRTALPSTATQSRVFVLGNYFIITYLATVSAASHLQFIAIPIYTPTSPSAAVDIYLDALSLAAGYDGYIANNNLYIACACASTTIKLCAISTNLLPGTPVVISSSTAALISVTADTSQSTAVVWLTWWDSGSTNGYTRAYSQNLVSILGQTQIITTTSIRTITTVSTASLLTIFYENINNYSYGSTVATDFITKRTVTQAGVVGTASVMLRSVGLASKAFISASGSIYMLTAFQSPNQPSYFLVDSTGAIYMRLNYSNGGGYATTQVLPSISLIDDTYSIAYLATDFLTSTNKGTNITAGTPVNALYTQKGVNLAKFMINMTKQYSATIAGDLHLTGGLLWQYDGVKPVEQGFNVWPDNVVGTTATGSGSISAQTYYYVFTYEWTDNQGNLHRSAPSIPTAVTTTTASSTNTLKVPTLRLTYKVAPNPVRIVGYRWSVAQQVYYQFTSLTSPTSNDTTIDSVTFTDTQADATILGNTLLYTTGGVIENIAPPASTALCLYKNRLFIVDAEDQNLLWYSKQVIENTPVEMSDLLTLYIAPTTGAQGSTGSITALAAMDDKLIVFKANAIYYVTGTGPDNTGSQNDFSDPIFVTSSVGCANPKSIVLMQNGLMFQSSKGIWLLGRDLSTNYIGNNVEIYNNQEVLSAESIPATNQVRFVLPNNVTLMYDYFYGQWGTFNNTQAISATLYQGMHTYLNSLGNVYQEQEGTYKDGSVPVLMSFTTSWVSLAGLQGYERFYFMYLLGTYKTPFNLNMQIGYDYNPNTTHSVLVQPDNYTAPWGGDNLWGGGDVWGGPSNAFEARVFPETQKCETFQIVMNELFDPSLGVPAGAGLTLSGLNLVVGVKKGYRVQKASRSFG